MDMYKQNVTDFVSFVWSGQEGLFEIAAEENKRRRLQRDTALAALGEARFFAPMARWRDGSKKSDVAAEGNVLWADIDSLDALSWIDERLSSVGLSPSAIIFSGNKGYWVYLKLSEMILRSRSSTSTVDWQPYSVATIAGTATASPACPAPSTPIPATAQKSFGSTPGSTTLSW